MKKAILTKLTLLLTVFALCVTAFAFAGVHGTAAQTVAKTSVSSYFGGTATVELDGTNLKATVAKDKNTLSVTNKLVADDLAIELSVPSGVKKFTVTLTSDSFVAGQTEKAVNTLTVDKQNGKIDLNGNSKSLAVPSDVTVKFAVADNSLSATVGGVNVANAIDDIAHKLSGKDKCAANVSFEFELADENGSADVLVKSIDQKASGTGYKQTFALTDGNIASFAKARAVMTTMPVNKNAEGKLTPIKNYKYNFTFAAYSVFASVSGSDVFFKENDGLIRENDTTPNSVAFINDGDIQISVGTAEDVLETYSVAKAVDRENDTNAPYYIDKNENSALYENYRKLVNEAAKKDYGEDGKHSIRLGDDYKIPSLENLVKDDYDDYAALTQTVYYRTPSSSTGSTSSEKFTVSEAGDYSFYVVFTDKNGNAMEKDSFFTVDENDENGITEGENYFAVFTFNVQDDAPLSVTAPASQGKGYVGTRYTATGFEIESSGNNVTYTLYYNADVNATVNSNGWIEIPKTSDVSDDYDKNGYKKSDIDEINYDGKYTFTPNAKGAYMIKCVATSVTNVRNASASTIIKVEEKATEVKVDTHWLQNNIWSVVFLGIGTLALIGIIILLFIKPKENPETDATGDALKSKKK